jgi:three-Cys-motif partner protein
MASKNLFRKPFDEGTISKLEILEDYFKEWLPVFIAKVNPIWTEIQIFDFFAGEGTDSEGVYGSPMRILRVLNYNKAQILQSKIKVKVIVNEYEKDKYDLLKKNLDSINDNSIYQVEYRNDDFSKVFNEFYNSMKSTVNFLFLDQNGIKQVTESVFKHLINLRQTDFLFFISSSYIKRFSELEEFNKYLRITKQDLENKSYYHIHRIVLNYYRSLIQSDKEFFLAPFSIKKPSGIYGLIFGTNHTYGMEKFLTVSWKHDKLTGEANYDIDNEKIDSARPSLFAELNIPSKRQVFEKTLTEKILSHELKTNIEAYLFALNEGFLLKDANIVLKKLKESKKIDFNFKLISSRLHKEATMKIKVN